MSDISSPNLLELNSNNMILQFREYSEILLAKGLAYFMIDGQF